MTSPSKGPVSGPSPTEIVIIIVCVIVVTVFLLIILAVVIIALCFYRRTRIKSLTFSPSIDHSSNSSCSDLAHYPDTPDLGRRNNGIELKAMEAFSDPMDVQFEPSGAIVKEEFAQHVERFDAKRQLLFQEEFEVSGRGLEEGGEGQEFISKGARYLLIKSCILCMLC